MTATSAPTRVMDHLLNELRGAHRILDIGCGSGALVRDLARRGFDPVGLDPQIAAPAEGPEAPAHPGMVAGRAEALPFPARTFDASVFLNSLHHIPTELMEAALGEAARCTRPGGQIVVVEPLAEGPLFEVVRRIDDETAVRQEAQAALDRLSLPVQSDCRFTRVSTYRDAEAFLASLLAGEPERATSLEIHRDALITALHRAATPGTAGLTLRQPMRLRSFRA